MYLGKCSLITQEHGSAIRLSSVITAMPFIANNHLNKSNCGTCSVKLRVKLKQLKVFYGV